MKQICISILLCYCFLYQGCTKQPEVKDMTASWVDPFIATEGDNGQLYPGATTPFGLVKLSPETTGRGQSGYQYQEKYIYMDFHMSALMALDAVVPEAIYCFNRELEVLIMRRKITGRNILKNQKKPGLVTMLSNINPGYFQS